MRRLMVVSLLVCFLSPMLLAQETAKPQGLKFYAEAGLGGGAAAGCVGLILPFAPRPEIGTKLQLGYGIGQNYNLTLAKAVVSYQLSEPMFLEGSVDYANYSTKVTGVGGLGDVDQGARFGVGIAAGRDFGRLRGKVGYSTTLGITAVAEYRF
ncbi:MAG: hypothetical protein ACPL4K_01360 [Candidatus Margulisiibacteriota bacterium]